MYPFFEVDGADIGGRLAIETAIVRAGGFIVEYETNRGEGTKLEEIDLVDQCDVYVTRYRAGRPYIKVRASQSHIAP